MITLLNVNNDQILTFLILNVFLGLVFVIARKVIKGWLGKVFPSKGLANAVRSYFIVMIVVLASLIFTASLYPDINLLELLSTFLIIGFWGMLGESLFSAIWRLFYPKPIWEYKVAPLFNRYTSWLNFPLWGLGGFMFILIARLFQVRVTSEIVFTLLVTLLVIILARSIFSIIIHKTLNIKFKDINLLNYSYFSLLILLPLLAAIHQQGLKVLAAALTMGLAAFVTEYLAGKALRKILGVKLWSYSYWTWDDDHTTPSNIIPFILAGFWFIAIVAI